MKLPPKSGASAPQPPPLPATPKPLVQAFTIVRRNGKRHVIALQLRGREVVNELVTDSCDWLEEAVDRFELLAKETFLFDRDVFEEERKREQAKDEQEEQRRKGL